jgi:NADH-quinone oxidoreductase subunit N
MILLAPIFPLLGVSLLGLISEIIFPDAQRKRGLLWLQALACAVGFMMVMIGRTSDVTALGNLLMVNPLSIFFQSLFLALGFLSFVLLDQYLKRLGLAVSGELPILLGMIVMALYTLTLSNDLILSWVLFELISIILYFCVGFFKNEETAREAALKYFSLGVFASAFLTLGVALLYPFSGSFSFTVIANAVSALTTTPPALSLAAFLILFALVFKLAVVPLHVWVPDVYSGTITPLTALMATAIKSMAVYLIVFVGFVVLKPIFQTWDTLLQLMVVATLLVGSILALTQTDFKRLLAYSSIVNAGYLLIGILCFDLAQASSWAVLAFFLLSYCAATFLLFYCVVILELDLGTAITNYRGLWQRSPFLSVALGVALLSLSGFPFFVGFVAKVYLFVQAASAGKLGLVFSGLAVTVISFYYYALPLIEIFLKEPLSHAPVSRPGIMAGGVVLFLTLFVLLGGLGAAPILALLGNLH